LIATGSPAIKVALAGAIARLDVGGARPALLALVPDDGSPDVRMAALRALRTLGIDGAETAITAALADDVAEVRMTALDLLPELGLPASTVVGMLRGVIDGGATVEQQRAVTTLGRLAMPDADRILAELVE